MLWPDFDAVALSAAIEWYAQRERRFGRTSEQVQAPRVVSRRGRHDPMLGTRILTAVVLISLVLAALFLLAPVGWGTASLLVMGVAASEWASLGRL
jgi:hypothetical protein